MNLSDIKVGDKRELSNVFSYEKVEKFAELSLDRNPIHLSEDYAQRTIFKKPIVHGMLYSSLISAIIANDLPGPGSIYKSQTLNFISPVYYDERITAVVEVIEIIKEKGIVILETIIYKNNDKDQLVVKGEACIKKTNPV